MTLRSFCLFAFLLFASIPLSLGEENGPSPEISPTPLEEMIKPTWETQKQARTYVLDIPAPRGQITDRHGAALAQNKLSYNLTIDFPTPLSFSDAEALAYARERIRVAEKLLGHSLDLADEAILRHYHN